MGPLQKKPLRRVDAAERIGVQSVLYRRGNAAWPFLGNSFSADFVQGFDQLVMSDKYSVTITASWGASPVADIPNIGPWDKANNYYWSEVVPALVSRLRSGDWIFLVSDLALFSEQTSARSERDLSQLKEALAKFSDRLSARGIRLAVLDGVHLVAIRDVCPRLRQDNGLPRSVVPANLSQNSKS